ncbi:MAG: serine/threonine protein kinase [Phycisphaerae bacterium]|nr:serine/threonine protein kinase [Phycisphaerae bacterium]
MKDDTSIFGAEPDRLDRLVFHALGQSEEEDEAAPTASLDAILEQHGGQIGRYKLLSVLGEGGMGVVHLAEQQRPIKRRVALKVIKPGMDSRRVVARFEAERQTLALLDHPNIAHVYDAGTTENGRPYFVMEYVKGLPITKHCDHHKLTVEDRLDLFLQVCHAVQHAHQKGIIHRDIKPTNIIVSTHDDQVVPKIIDFGVAKAVSQSLTEKTLFTEQGQLVGTPEYMSPEQADEASEDIDTRSDIYSLGVVLYQLLTGVLPFDSDTLREGGIDHVRKVICEQDPKTPSTRLRSLGEEAETVAQKRQTDVTSLTRRLHRELEWIPLKAVRKDRTRRYRSVAEFADDIENYLRGLPLIAGPESVTYRIRKFVRRHRAAVVTAGTVAVVLLLATVTSTVLYVRAVSATESHRRLLYVNQITLAHSAYREADIGRAQSLLTSCPADFRDFAWSYLRRLCQVVPETPTIPHAEPVNAVAFSPTAEMLASASDNTIRLWDASTRSLQATLKGHKDIVKSLAFSPDGRMLASASEDQPAILWDLATRQQVRTLAGQTVPVGNIAVNFSRDGKTVAAGTRIGGSGSVVLWDVNTGKSESLPESNKTFFSLVFSPDEKLLAATGVQQTTLWDVATRQRIATLGGHSALVNSAAFLPDGRTLATTGNDGTLRFWDVTTRKQLPTINAHSAPVLSMALSPDGAVLATGSADSTIRLWDTVTRQETKRLRGHSSEVRSLAFSADGTVLASASKDRTVKLWELADRPDSDTLYGHNAIVHGVVFSPDSRRIISTSYGATAVKMWDVASGRDLSPALGIPPMGLASCADFSLDGKTLAIGFKDLVLWDLIAKKPIDTLAHRDEIYGGGVNEAVFSPDGKTLATQTYNRMFKLWDISTRKELISLKGYGSHYGAVAFSPDSRTLAVPHEGDLAITLWDASALRNGRAESPAAPLTGHRERVNAVAFSPDGATLASGSDDTTIRLWDLATHREPVVLTGHTSNVHSLAFSLDGRTLASGGNDGTVRLWNLVLYEQVAVLEGHGSAIWDIAFSPDGLTLASTSFDGTVKLWRAATEHEIQIQRAPIK